MFREAGTTRILYDVILFNRRGVSYVMYREELKVLPTNKTTEQYIKMMYGINASDAANK